MFHSRIRCFVSGCDTRGSFFGLEFALSGYNILFGYPKENRRDPGWRAGIFQAVYDPPRFTSDCSHQLPKGINMLRTVACDTSFESQETKSRKDMDSALKANAHVSGGGWGVSFSASTSYNRAVQEMKDTQSIYIFSEARCLYYASKLDPTVPPPLAENFKVSLQELERVGTQAKYFDFFDSYGTHFVKAIDYGARYTKQHKMSQEAYKKSNQMSYNLEVTARYEGIMSVSGGAGLNEDQKKAVDEFRKEVKTTTSTLGALPVASGNKDDWASEVKDAPAPIIYTLESIENLFTAKYFRGVNDIDYDAIKAKINTYKMQYCQALKARGQTESCAALEGTLHFYIASL